MKIVDNYSNKRVETAGVYVLNYFVCYTKIYKV